MCSDCYKLRVVARSLLTCLLSYSDRPHQPRSRDIAYSYPAICWSSELKSNRSFGWFGSLIGCPDALLTALWVCSVMLYLEIVADLRGPTAQPSNCADFQKISPQSRHHSGRNVPLVTALLAPRWSNQGANDDRAEVSTVRGSAAWCQ